MIMDNHFQRIHSLNPASCALCSDVGVTVYPLVSIWYQINLFFVGPLGRLQDSFLNHTM